MSHATVRDVHRWGRLGMFGCFGCRAPWRGVSRVGTKHACGAGLPESSMKKKPWRVPECRRR
eukprot:10794052-Alexandrium_andersonii.AAC.1